MLILNSAADTMNLNSEVPEVEEDEMDISSRDNEIRQYFLGGQIYMAAGSFSAYHGFRSAVRAHKEEGKFKFLTHEEKVDDILRAPFEFDFLSRKTTYIPLLIASGFMVLSSSSYSQIFKGNSFNFSDAFYGSAYSYLAGTHEEAMYRGWLMPVFMESWDSPFWSNATTSALFAAAHISDDNPVPWPQLLMGWYLGWMTQRNQWSLKEAVFLHTWWDVVIITGSYFIEARQDKERAVLRLPVMTLSF
jgi:membrane protease YdiL (CAAX protease family)